MIISVETTGKSTAGGALLWPYVSYSLMKKFCQKKSDDIRPVNEQAKPEAPNPVEDVRFSYEGEKRTTGGSYRFDGKDFLKSEEEVEAPFSDAISPMTEEDLENVQDDNMTQEDENTEIISDVKRILPLFTILLLVLSIICNINQYVKIEELEEESKFVSYPSDYNENKNKARFLDQSIVFVIEGYGDYYYTYDEMMRVMDGKGEFSFWAYNKELAIANGYIAAFRH